MKNQLMAEFAAMNTERIAAWKAEILREQQAELASLREALAQKQANRPAPTVTAAPAPPAPVQLKTPDTSRRKMLKRMGLAVLAGGAALGVTAATYSPAEAKSALTLPPRLVRLLPATVLPSSTFPLVTTMACLPARTPPLMSVSF